MFSFKADKVIKPAIPQGAVMAFPYKSKGDDKGEEHIVKVQDVTIEDLRRVIQEIVLAFNCTHENVLPIKGYDLLELPPTTNTSNTNQNVQNRFQVYIKMPKMEKSLKDQLGKSFEEKTILKYFYSITCGLRYLHGKNIAHRDIKPENILLDKHDIIKIADIGRARHLEDQSASNIPMAGSRLYTAPEVLARPLNEPPMGKHELQKADLWSLGVTMLELCLRRQPSIKLISSPSQTENKLAKEIKTLEYSSSLTNLLANLLKCNPNDRIGTEKLFITLRQLLDLPPLNTGDEENENEPEEYGENKIKNEQEQVRLSSGDVRQQEEAGRREDLLDIRERLRRFYGGFCSFEAEKTAMTLEIVLNPNMKKSIDEATVNIILKGVIEELKQNNHCKLAHLTVKLDECTKFTDKGLIELVSHLDSTFENLQHLHLSFAQCNKITDQGLVKLITHIASALINLQRLYLNFSYCSEITDSAFQQLAAQITSNLRKLEQLSLNFAGCNKITDSGAKGFVIQIPPNLENLKSFDLDLTECKISADLKRDLEKTYKISEFKLKLESE